MPACRLEVPLELRGLDPRHHAVETLPVQVDDPEDVPRQRGERLHQRLPEIALVKLGVTEQRDEAPAGRAAEPRLHVPIGDGAEQRSRRTEPDRARRVVDGERVLRPRGVALQAAELAQLRQVGAVEAAEQVLDRVQHRRRVRLDRDAILRAQIVEVERGHQAHHRGRRRLVPAHLELVTLRPLAVRVVHDANRQPQHAALDRAQELGVDGALRGERHHQRTALRASEPRPAAPASLSRSSRPAARARLPGKASATARF